MTATPIPYIELGTRCRDSVTGWVGVATARTEYLNGCVRYMLEALDKDGKPAEYYYDAQQLEVRTANGRGWTKPKVQQLPNVVTTEAQPYPRVVREPAARATGGPRSAPRRSGH